MFPYPNGKTPLCPDSPTGCGAKRPSYWTGRLSYRIAFSPMGEAFLGKRRVRPFRRSLRAARFRAWSRSPLAGQVARLGETDPSRLLALCVAAMPLPAPWRPPLFPSFHRPPKGGHLSSEHGRRLAWAACGALAVARPASPPFGRKDTPPDSRPCAMRTPPAPCSARRSPTCAARSTPCRWRASSKTALPDCAAAGKTTPHSRPSICCRTCTPPCRTPSTSASTA